jgi:hypothetical protein
MKFETSTQNRYTGIFYVGRAYLIASIFLCISITSCKKEFQYDRQQANDITTNFSFQLLAKNNPETITYDINCSIDSSNITGLCPLRNIPDSMIASFSFGNAVVTVNNIKQISGVTPNDFRQPVIYTLTFPDSLQLFYKVVLSKFTGLAIINITTQNNAAITSKDDYVNGHVTIDSNSIAAFQSYDGDMQIRLHGNSTLSFPKLPYKIKLNSKASLLGMPADKEWVLLANFSDKSLLRNYVAFQTSIMFGLPYTPRSEFAEVYLNGVFQGNYQLTEEIKIATNRVNITEMSTTDVGNKSITGGYLLEVDNRLDGTDVFTTNLQVPFVIHDPNGVPAQDNYIQNYVQTTENAIYSSNFADTTTGYAKYMNAESFIDWFWVNELMKNNDAIFFSSCWMYKDRSNILYMGPVWDFDIAAGNVNYSDCQNPQGWWVKNSVWISQLFKDPAFAKKAMDRWTAVRSQLNSLNTIIDAKASYLYNSQVQNFRTWNILNEYIWPNAVVTGSYASEVAYMESWLALRIAWIDANLQTLAN